MTRYFLRTLGVHLRAGRTLALLNLFGVSLGVASVLSIQIINRNALGAFEGGIAAVSGEADLSVLAGGPVLPETLFPEVIAVEGVEAAWPLCRFDVSLRGRDGIFLQVIGVDFFSTPRLPWRRAPGDLAMALGSPGWAAVTPELARAMGWSTGSVFEVTSGTRVAALSVGAMVDFKKLSPLASSRLVVMDIAQAQSLFGRRGAIDQIDLRLTGGTTASAVGAALQRRLGPGVRIATPGQRAEAAAGLLDAFRLNLTALSLISLFVGGFLVYSTTQAALVRRRTEFGVLRSLGATRGQVLGLILAEAAVMGAAGVAVGLPLGYWVAVANVETVSATLSNLYLLERIESLELPVSLWLLAALVGVGGAAAGALLPALDTSRRDTHALLAPFTLRETIGSAAPRLFVVGLAFSGAAWLAAAALGRQWKPGGFLMGIAVLAAITLMTPFALDRACSLAPVRSFSVAYGFRSLGRRLQTTSVAVAALAVAVTMLIGITIMIGSFRRTLEIWVERTVRADVYVSTASWGRGREEAALSAGVLQGLAAHPGVRSVDRLRQFIAHSGSMRFPVSGVDMSLPEGERRFSFLGGDPEAMLRAAREEGAILIGEPLAVKAGLGRGGHLDILGPSGPLRFLIAGVYHDYGSESGSVMMDLETMEDSFGLGPVNNAALYLEPGLDSERVIDELRARFEGVPLEIRSNRRLREEVMAIFDQTFAVTRLLRVMSLLIAVAGITVTMLVLLREKMSELALYRALGASRGQIFTVFLGHGLAMSGTGLALGAAGGAALAAILIVVINKAWFGWTIAAHMPWGALLRDGFVIVAASTIASIHPALRASRTPATELSRDDL